MSFNFYATGSTLKLEFIPNFSGSLNNALEKAVIKETGLFGYTRDILASIIIYSYNVPFKILVCEGT